MEYIDTFTPSISNQITKKYYEILILSNPKTVLKVARKNGTHVYYTYHLITKM